MLAEIDPSKVAVPPIVEVGYYYPKVLVDRYALWLDRWGIPPDVVDRQNKFIVMDLELRAAMKSQSQREYWKERDTSSE